MLLPLFEWIAEARYFAWIRDSQWAFPIVEMAHLLGLAILGGTVLLINLALLGIRLRRGDTQDLARELRPLFLGSLVTMIVSGVLLMSSEALKCYYNPAFRLKMLLLLLAVVFSFTVCPRVLQGAPSVWTRVTAMVSLILWLGVGLAGRAIGFI
jgi:hypothetical protein